MKDCEVGSQPMGEKDTVATYIRIKMQPTSLSLCAGQSGVVAYKNHCLAKLLSLYA